MNDETAKNEPADDPIAGVPDLSLAPKDDRVREWNAILKECEEDDPEEFAEMRRHTINGEEMLEVLREDHPQVLEIVRWHHEHVDGTGFPDGLAGSAIPLAARIVSVVDAFDAMTSTRTYREMQDARFAFAELEKHSGTQFDADIVEAFTYAFPDVASLLPTA